MIKNNLSEFSFITQIQNKLKLQKGSVIKGIGDDAAVIRYSKDKYHLYTCDSLVSGVHFSEKYSTPYQIGRKAVAINVSDIAAMGGKPSYLLSSLFLPNNTTEKYIDELYDGLVAECNLHNVTVIGGNIVKSDQFAIDLFLVGEVPRENLLLRSGANVGDLVLVTGTLGDSAAGLIALQNHQLSIPKSDKEILIQRHLVPTPRIREGVLIAQLKKATAMIDISDGLSSDIGHICDESNVGVQLYATQLPISESVKKITSSAGLSAMDIALNGGEDYELCFTLPPQYVSIVSQKLEKKGLKKITVIGEILRKEQGRWLVGSEGKKVPLKAQGWDHFHQHIK